MLEMFLTIKLPRETFVVLVTVRKSNFIKTSEKELRGWCLMRWVTLYISFYENLY